MSDKKLSCRIIALNYNGLELLKKYLSSWVRSAQACSYPCQVSVLDNCSVDGSVEYVKENFPNVHIYRAKENKVLCSYNEMAREVVEDILILINNDIETTEGFADPLIEPFSENKNVFFVGTHLDRSAPKSRWGIIGAESDYDTYHKGNHEPGYTFVAGCAAFSREKFLTLGGYDDLYLPGYYEDVDLCFRGWKRGWLGLYAPNSKVFHIGAASFSKNYRYFQKQAIVFRNSVFFMMKNIQDPLLLLQFYACIIPRLLSALLTGKFFILNGFFQALKKAGYVLSLRAGAVQNAVWSDRRVLCTVRGDFQEDGKRLLAKT